MIGPTRLIEALLQENYFPRAGEEYIPPVFTTRALTPTIAAKFQTPAAKRGKGGLRGFDCVGYTQTKFNLDARGFSIPHPRAYAPLCFCIRDNWTRHLAHVCESEKSIVKPRDQQDGRISAMSYDEKDEGELITLDQAFGMRYVSHADISKFYPSVYTHAICWAAVGVSEAKEKTGDRGEWFNALDKCQRLTTRDETKGIPIGPATSLILAEFILQHIDESLERAHFGNFRRAIDDYTFYAKSEEESEKFIDALRVELGKFNLQINQQKTRISKLPDPSGDSWIYEINMALAAFDPKRLLTMRRMLDHIVVLADKHPDKSVLKYAAKSLLRKIRKIRDLPEKAAAYERALAILVNLAYHCPAIVPLLEQPFKFLRNKRGDGVWKNHRAKVEKILRKGVDRRWSDVTAWTLEIFRLFGDRPGDEIAAEIIRRQDCLPLVLLCLVGHKDAAVKFASEFIAGRNGNSPNCHALDRQWLLLYQLFLAGEIPNPYSGVDNYAKQCFDILRKHRVSFLAKGAEMR